VIACACPDGQLKDTTRAIWIDPGGPAIPEPPPRTRVAHWGTGATGSFALRGILADPALELVGLHVTNPEKVGRDAGEPAGIARVGVAATSDVEALLDLQPDCLLYAGSGADRELEAARDMARFLERGIDVAWRSR
jgi:hypothetical protein